MLTCFNKEIICQNNRATHSFTRCGIGISATKFIPTKGVKSCKRLSRFNLLFVLVSVWLKAGTTAEPLRAMFSLHQKPSAHIWLPWFKKAKNRSTNLDSWSKQLPPTNLSALSQLLSVHQQGSSPQQQLLPVWPPLSWKSAKNSRHYGTSVSWAWRRCWQVSKPQAAHTHLPVF